METEDRDRLIRIDERTLAIVGRLEDHRKRLRALEVTRNMAAGAVAVCAVVAGWFKVKLSVQ